MRVLALLIALGVGLVPADAHASWRRLKAYLQPKAHVVRESDEELVVSAPGLARPVVIREKYAKPCDIYSRTVFRRGGNPYQVWLATPAFAQDTSIPRRAWGVVFKTAFLRILRVPKRPRR